VNALRSTVACFAAGVAGADAVTVLPHDGLRESTELGRRVARNTQSILIAESHLAEVADPAGGSWYVERLTDQLAEAAWTWLQEIEKAGGFRRAVTDGLVAERIASTAEARQRDLDTRRAPLTGLSAFPNIAEASPPAMPDTGNGPLAPRRWAAGFEDLRERVERSDRRPTIFLATIGPPAAFTPRATFAENFFGIAGLPCRRGPADDFAASGSSIACICSTDALYAEHAANVAAELTAAGAAAVYLAGKPQAGIERTIHAGIDARATLAELLDLLEIT
jgi:methylmalonyl-CoA mutase